MKFCPSSRDDIVKYYKGTYIKLKEFGEDIFLIESVNSTHVMGTHESGERFTIYLDEATPYEVEYILPHKSFFQFGPDALMLERVPAKQYYRGLCSQNTNMRFMGTDGRLTNSNITWDTLKAFVHKKGFLPLPSVVNDVNYNTVAISPRFMYRRSNKNLYVDFRVIGKVRPEDHKVVLTETIFMDEVKELLEVYEGWSVEKYTPPPPRVRTTTEDLLKEMGAAPKKTAVKLENI